MKTARRHELRENDLAQQIGAAADALRQHGLPIILGVVVVIAAVVGVNLYASNQAAAVDEAWKSLGLSAGALGKTPEERITKYRELAEQKVSPVLSGLALKLAADTAVNAMTEARGKNDAAAVRKWNDQAKQFYERVRNEYDGVTSAAGAARLGLGFLAEDRGEYKEAESIYKTLIADARFANTPFVEQAKYRVEQMPKWQTKVVFAPASRPASAPAFSVTPMPPTVMSMPPAAATQPAGLAAPKPTAAPASTQPVTKP